MHEIGHAFAGLADEYADAGQVHRFPLPTPPDDLSAANVTLWRMVDESSADSIAATVKWRHFLELPGARDWPWLYSGGYYRASLVFRPWKSCCMRDGDEFCPVCDEEVAKAIVACLGETWDDAAWHEQRPLSDWH